MSEGPATEGAEIELPDREAFERDGFAILHDPIPILADPAALETARTRLEAVLRGEYDTGTPPTKPAPTAGSDFRFSDGRSGRTLQVINVWHCDAFFRRLVTDPRLGRLIAHLTGWPAVRLAQDQAWVKPPGAGPLAFHRDTTYFDFTPKEVCTLWLTLDATAGAANAALGPLEYCAASHRWGDTRRGSARLFFDPDHTALLRAAAAAAAAPLPLRLTRVEVPAGGGSVHDGRTWHGSGPNTSAAAWRRGLGVHFVRGDAVFGADVGALWTRLGAVAGAAPDPATFPIVWPPAPPGAEGVG